MDDVGIPNRNLNLLYPPFRAQVEQGLAICHQQGLMAYVFEGLRTPARQEWLYRQGRSRPGKIITNARSNFSWHQYGVAVDIVFDGSELPGIQWSWDGDYAHEKTDEYQLVADNLMPLGIEWYGQPGQAFFEKPHFQKTWGLRMFTAQQLVATHGTLAVWNALDKIIASQGVVA